MCTDQLKKGFDYMRFGDETNATVLDVTYLSMGNTVAVVRRGKTIKAAILSNNNEWLEIEPSEVLTQGTVISGDEFEAKVGKSWPPFFSHRKVMFETNPSGPENCYWEDEIEHRYVVVEKVEKK